MAKISKTLPPSTSFNMKLTDTLQFTFGAAGIFCSTDGDDFNPPLPIDTQFEEDDVWPDEEEYPDGATPTADADAHYRFEPGDDTSCEDIIANPMHTIHVGS